MEFEQIIRQLEWLDEERRKDKATIATLQKRLESIQGDMRVLKEQNKELREQVAALTSIAIPTRLEQFEHAFAEQRADFNKALEDIERRHKRREREAEKRRKADVEQLQAMITEVKKAIPPLKRALTAQDKVDDHLSKEIAELRNALDELNRGVEETKHGLMVSEETHKQHTARLTDLQGELSALRKRLDEQRQKVELSANGVRQVTKRIEELLQAEAERKKAQVDFLEQQALAQVERERAWKEWQEQYKDFQQQSQHLQNQLQLLDETVRAAQKARETYTDLNTRLERRVNELTEMQRLAEERLRQEWVSFKADEQKRWTAYTLSQEESLRDVRQEIDKLEERLTALDDVSQILRDQIEQTTEATEQQLQNLMNWAHEWLTAYERIMGHRHKAR
ncbi:MAG: hypothetical protein D6770_03760 [Anaerolineae bacterium]|nr:MAG: hypothetical protein D6770_03760 [Anaerolineae bacterium]